MQRSLAKGLISILFLLTLLFASPKEEFRAAWLTTVYAADWPSSTTVSTQKSEMIAILDKLEEWKFNAVMFQVRPACDAFYMSAIEPWSMWLTGNEGVAPSPLYDPLQFVIDEARKRNIEVHAWFNPYRVKEGSSSTSLNHVYNTHPEWVLTVGASSAPAFAKGNAPDIKTYLACDATSSTTYILDPGKADVRAYVLSVITDVATRYDIDGIHLDDYFYPYDGMGSEDAATFASESRGFSDISDWRRDNIHLMIKAIHDELETINPRLKFGVSPFGIWKSGTPAGIIGTSSYYQIYCDAVNWLDKQWVDYVAPQLYWPFGGNQDYGLLMPWWSGKAKDNNRHIYVGHGAYKITDWTEEEIPDQISLNRTTSGCEGSIYFSYRHMNDNPKGVLDSLEDKYYTNFAIPSLMDWKETKPAPTPINVELAINEGTASLSWEAGSMGAENDDSAWSYIVYKWPDTQIFDKNNSSYIAAIIPSSETLSYSTTDYKNYNFAVTSLDRLKNESEKATPSSANVVNELNLDFEDDSDVSNWGKHDESDFGTSCTWSATGGVDNSGALYFSDPGWTFLIKREFTAADQSDYTLTFYIKTSGWTHSTNTLNAKLTGLSTVEPETAVSAYSDYTQVTLSGTADAGTSGYLRFHGVNIGTPVTVWIDNLSWTVESDESSGGASPITLSSFITEMKEGKVNCKWETASEVNNSHFVIYRNNIAIARIEGAGTSTETHYYEYNDDQIIPGQTYSYILADIDYAGKETRYNSLTQTITIPNESPEMDFLVGLAYPNPFNPQTTIPIELSKSAQVRATLHDLKGTKLRTLYSAYAESGSKDIVVKGQDLTSGIYIVNIIIDNQQHAQKLVLVK